MVLKFRILVMCSHYVNTKLVWIPILDYKLCKYSLSTGKFNSILYKI